ncbi:Glycosyl hydrolase family 1 [Popillia japonica]|uniref:Glycosyl hydrolase family 1 n=1 Tax=Popillia japonica TaxID=7064 RepID=A0AAW1KQQ1_POPJA
MKTPIVILLLAYFCKGQQLSFDSNFRFGVATASYQVEGAWNIDGKGESIWDHLTHTQSSYIVDGSNGDIACDAYHKTAEDVQRLVDLGVDFYRFSISWPRIFPSGHRNYINQAGIDYYNGLIDELLAHNITPMVTMYHWDLPQSLQEIGGWPNPLLVNYFVDYADVLFSSFGDRVKEWITFNEPVQVCSDAYSTGGLAPAYTQDGIGGYLCSYTLLMAHARTYELYNNNYRDTQNGRVGITLSASWGYPASNSDEDVEAAENFLQFKVGWFAHPIFSSTGDFPTVMKERIAQLSQEEGFPRSRLPSFTDEEVALLKGSSDFFGLNHYTTNECSVLPEEDAIRPSQQADHGALCVQPPGTEVGGSDWLYVVPEGIRNLLNWIRTEYDNPEVMITENGFSDRDGDLNDCRRINYFNEYLQNVLEAIEDGCNVTTYTAWSFMDNFEWMKGYSEKFGLYYVDFNDDDRPRTPKMSAYVAERNLVCTT